jgi:hypothetical protein
VARQFQLTAAIVTGSCLCPLTQIRAMLDQPFIRTTRLSWPVQEELGVAVGVGVGEDVGVAVAEDVGVAVGVADGVGVRVKVGIGVVAVTWGVAGAVAVGEGVTAGGVPGSNSTSAMAPAGSVRRKLVFNPCGVMIYVPGASGANSKASTPYSGLDPT